MTVTTVANHFKFTRRVDTLTVALLFTLGLEALLVLATMANPIILIIIIVDLLIKQMTLPVAI